MYAGSFDGITNGHVHIIDRALKIFDKVTIVIGTNPNKKCMFSLDERLAMVKNVAMGYGTSFVDVKVLPQEEYLVNFAQANNISFLVRGIRDSMDFGYEQQLGKTNKHINPNVETVYLMPDRNHEMVSSSWVKSLAGKRGWTKVLQNYVPASTLYYLKRNYIRDRLANVIDSPALMNVFKGHIDHIFEKVEKAYSTKPYHNFDHIISMIEGLDAESYENDPLIYYAAIMHDVAQSEEESALIASAYCKNFGSKMITSESPKERVERLIKATNHREDHVLVNADEQVLASLDLLILASDCDTYASYRTNVRAEYKQYSDEEFRTGRIKFLLTMLGKDKIFPDPSFADKLDASARKNMEHELEILREQDTSTRVQGGI